jgi:uroporphyrinogen decarboxylase
MIKTDRGFFSLKTVLDITEKRTPDFSNMLKVLDKKVPGRPTLFEFFLNDELYKKITGRCPPLLKDDYMGRIEIIIESFRKMGYDYITLPASFSFTFKDQAEGKSISQNDTMMIYDRKSYNDYDWPDAEKADYSYIGKLKNSLPHGMKYIAYSPGGVLENVTMLLGYENMCYMLYDETELLCDVFERVGEILCTYYDKVMDNDCIGAAIVNDDWGYKSQTMLSVEDMRKYVIPWHKKMADRIHRSGKPAILHSCGNLDAVYGDIIDDIGYDGKHSYEDIIQPVEVFYEEFKDRIAVLGGIDLNFVCTKKPEEIFGRAAEMLKRAETKGGYALGTGNSVPGYVPDVNYFALILAALAYK